MIKKAFLFLLLVSAGCSARQLPNLDSADPYERALAILDFHLEEMTPEREALLVKFLSPEEPMFVRDAALIVIGDFRLARFAPRVVERMGDPEAEVRARGCITLSELGDPDQVFILAKTLRLDADSRVRRRAAYALGRFPDGAEVRLPLFDGMKDRDASVRQVSFRMLKKVTEREDLPGDPVEAEAALEKEPPPEPPSEKEERGEPEEDPP